MDDLFVMDLERRFSHLGYAFWFKTLELIGSQGTEGKLVISWPNYLQKIRTRRATVVQLLESCRDHGKLVFEDKGETVEITCPKFLEYASDYVKYDGAMRQRLLRQDREGSATSHNRIEEEVEEKKKKKKKKKIGARVPRAIPPDPKEVWEYAKTIGLTKIDCRAWWDHHAARGWKLGRGIPMKDWKAALRTWKKKKEEFAKEQGRPVMSSRSVEPMYTCRECGKVVPLARAGEHICPSPSVAPTEDEVEESLRVLKKNLKP